MGKINKHFENRRAGSYFKNAPDKPRGFFTLADVWPKPEITPRPKPTATKSQSDPTPLKSPAISTPISKRSPLSAPKKPVVLFKDVVTTAAPRMSNVPGPGPDAQHNGSSQRRLMYEQEMASALEKTQRQAERPIRIILGVDLGTSCTKVVWRDEVADQAYPICFGSRPTILEDYLLPSVVAFDGARFAGGGDIEDFIVAHPKAERFSNFKMCLACVSSPRSACNLQHCALSYWRPVLSKHLSEEEAVEIVTTLHLGKVISLSKELVSLKLTSDGVHAPIQWIVNMAAPVEHMDDKDVLSAFERVLKTGYLMAEIFDEQRGARELGDLLDCYRSARQLATKRVMDCFVIPEVGAQVISMCLSRASRDGLYAFVDVGAGTVDATFFRLHLSGDTPQISFYSDGVLKVGAAHLESIASRQLAEKALKWFRQMKEKHSMDGGKTLLEAEEAKGLLDRAGAWLSDEVETGIRHLSASAFQKEMNHSEWKKLILVLGGGGATHPMYDKASRQAVCLLAPNVHMQQLPVPKDMNMKGLPSSVFHRFAVAYGLSFNKINLPDFNLPGQVDPDRPRQLGSMPECATPDVG